MYMNHHLSRPLAALLTAAVMAAPIFASAQATSTPDSALGGISAQIQALLQQIKTLQDNIRQLQQQAISVMTTNAGTTTTRGCRFFDHDFSLGSQGEDVRDLQKILGRDPSIFNASTTGFFGPLTAKAVKKFQEKFGVASSSTGVVGPRTRNFLRDHCEKIGHEDGDRGDDNESGGLPGEREIEHAFGAGSTSPFFIPRPPRPEDRGGQGQGGGGAGGQITAVGSSSIDVRGPNGVTKTIQITATTNIQVFDQLSHQFVAGTIASLTVGQFATINGALGSDGTFTAIGIRVGVPLGTERGGGKDRGGGGDN